MIGVSAHHRIYASLTEFIKIERSLTRERCVFAWGRSSRRGEHSRPLSRDRALSSCRSQTRAGWPSVKYGSSKRRAGRAFAEHVPRRHLEYARLQAIHVGPEFESAPQPTRHRPSESCTTYSAATACLFAEIEGWERPIALRFTSLDVSGGVGSFLLSGFTGERTRT